MVGGVARAVAEIDLGAVQSNCRELTRRLGSAELCAVVKADGYGHGAAQCARAAQAGGATRLAVATAAEAQSLRSHGIGGSILVMGALSSEDLDVALDARAEVAVWRGSFLREVDRRARKGGRSVGVHVKADTGMGRLGASREAEIFALASDAASTALPNVETAGVMTHFATADEIDDDFFPVQLERFGRIVERIKTDFPALTAHAANSAAVIRDPRSRFDMARCGVGVYGLDPFHRDPTEHGLKPALSLTSYVALGKEIAPGASVGYGRTWRADSPTVIGVVPIGYGDGVRRALSNRGQVLVGGRTAPIVGTVSMDNITIDLGPSTEVGQGDLVTLIGGQDGSRILVEDVARSVGTINYEIVCGLSSRVARRFSDPESRGRG